MPQQADKSLDLDTVPAELVRLRKSIDKMDEQIIRLLKERSEIVAEVGKFKRREGTKGCFIRPGREAEMLRNIWKDFSASGKFSAVAGCAIWRHIIAASTMIEGDLRISVCAGDGEESLFWLAREYFGTGTKIARHTNTNRVIGDVVDGKAEVGILPPLHSEQHGDWWLTLARQEEEQAPQLFAHVPFITSDLESNRFSSFAVAHVKPEATGDDVTLLVIHTQDISVHRLLTAFSQAGIKATRIQFVGHADNSAHHLVRAEGFISADDRRLPTLFGAFREGLLEWRILGAYAVPIHTRNPC